MTIAVRHHPRLVVLALLGLLGLLVTLLGPTPAGAARTWTVRVGGGTRDADLLDFFPDTLRIQVGDTVTWTWEVGAPHTVTFAPDGKFPPLESAAPGPAGGRMFTPQAFFPTPPVAGFDGTTFVNSGFIQRGPQDGPKTFRLTFTRPGTYTYQCLLHPFMRGQIIVVDPGTPVPGPEVQTREGEEDRAEHLASIPPFVLKETVQQRGRTASGQVWTIAAGTGPAEMSVNRFLPGVLTIDAGDTVVWEARHPTEPHTITFLAGEMPPAMVIPQPKPQGPPLLLLNPRFWGPSTPPRPEGIPYDGRGFLNSGIIAPGTSSTYAVTFTQPGSYPYVCLLHPGMHGIINVRPRGSWPPVVVDGVATHTADTVTYAFTVRNVGTSPISGVNLAVPLPAGSTVLTTWAVEPTLNPGQNTGTEVQWFGPAATLAPGQTRGPFVVTVRLSGNQVPEAVHTHAWVSFAQPVAGTAVSAEITAGPPFEMEEH
jgi:uncharacterized repeat protein (TIGR01451 family)